MISRFYSMRIVTAERMFRPLAQVRPILIARSSPAYTLLPFKMPPYINAMPVHFGGSRQLVRDAQISSINAERHTSLLLIKRIIPEQPALCYSAAIYVKTLFCMALLLALTRFYRGKYSSI